MHHATPHGVDLGAWVLIAWCLAHGCAAGAEAGSPIPAAEPIWVSRVWKTDDGLPGNNVTGLAQSRDGYLWISTQNGLARFDGARIQRIALSPDDPHPTIWAMLLDRDERLWLALEGGDMVCVGPDQIRAIPQTNRFLPTARMVQTRDGAVWIGYNDGSVSSISGDALTRYSSAEGLLRSRPTFLSAEPGGELWFAQRGRMGRFHDGRFVVTQSTEAQEIQGAPSADGGMWICAGGRLFKRASGMLRERGQLPAEEGAARPSALHEDRHGALWIGTTYSGLFRFDGSRFVKVETSHRRIYAISEDREGNIWVGTMGGGLNRVRRGVVELHGTEEGLPFETVNSTCEDAAGRIWAVTENGAVALLDNGKWWTTSDDPSWPGGLATCVAADRQGAVWIGTEGREMYRWHEGEFTAVKLGTRVNPVRSLLADQAGNLWIATANGVFRRSPDGNLDPIGTPQLYTVRTMVEDAAGEIWLGTLRGTLLRVRDDQTVDETPQPRQPVRCLAATEDGSLWLGYKGAGVGRWREGKLVRIGVEQGLHDGDIAAVMADGQGRMWFTSAHGIFYVRLRELDAVAEGRAARVESIVFGRDESVPSVQGRFGFSPGPARCRDGRILLPTHSGLAIVHPEAVRPNRVAPPVVIESVLVDGVRSELWPIASASGVNSALSPQLAKHTLAALPLVRVPAGGRTLEVRFTAPSFVAPEKLGFRYRLEGWDLDWIEAGNERRALYARVPAGDYRFAVSARNSSGVCSEVPAQFAVTVEPFFWETWWFRALSTLAAVGVIAAAIRYVFLRRVQLAVKQLEQETAVQRERARIARDIHDELGARMTQISLLADLTEKAAEQPVKAVQYVKEMAGISRDGIKLLDEIVWTVNPRNDTLPNLLDYVGQYAAEFLRAAGVHCRLDFPEEPPARQLSADVRHSLFLAIKEALHNIVKHAHATEAWLRLEISDAMLRWTVEDNGCGFDVAREDGRGDGLRNMRARIAAAGGGCVIESDPGGGTRIIFEVSRWGK